MRRRIEVRASRERAYETIARLEGIRHWWTTCVSGSDKAGGTIVLELEGEQIEMRVLTAERPSKVAWEIARHTSHEEWSGTTVAFQLASTGAEACVLDFLHLGLTPKLACYEGCEAGWEHSLASLVAQIERGKGEPLGA